MQVLIAEDDGISRHVLTKSLEQWQYDVISTKNGEDAWAVLQQTDAPHMAILDWMMPGMDGVDVCRRLRQMQKDPQPYIILLTGKSQKRNLVQAFDAGVDDYITKPFNADELRVRVRAGEQIIRLQVQSAVAMESLRKQATHDALTGILNRTAILQATEQAFARSSRTNTPMAVIMVDLDQFKQINDAHGHSAGDYVLTEVTKSMASLIRSYEAIGRYGGEEFLIVLSDCDSKNAINIAERLRQEIEQREFVYAGERLKLTASFGVSSSSFPHPSINLLINAADTMLYKSKNNGRNIVTAAWLSTSGEMHSIV